MSDNKSKKDLRDSMTADLNDPSEVYESMLSYLREDTFPLSLY